MGRVYRVGAALVDPGLCRIERDGGTVALQPKLLALLLHLIEHRDRVVTRDELFRAVWPGVVVGESSLTRAMSALRTALGDSAAGSRVIRTVARRGYQLVAPVEEIPRTGAPAAAARSDDPFVGRDAPLARLLAAWEAARAGRGAVVVLSGEAGIGKTRLAEELAAHARASGGRVLNGFCPSAGGAPAFWPWVRALRGVDEQEGSGVLAAVAKDARVELGDLLPEHASGAPSSGLADAAPARFAVLDALDRLLAAFTAQRPLLLVLDDVHWADRSSLRALDLVARGVARTRLLLLAIHREEDVTADHPLRETLAGLARGGDVLRLRLEPLAEPDADRLVAALAPRALEPEIASAIRARSAGNPLFLRELVRACTQDGVPPVPGSPLPPGITELIRSRVERLPATLRQLLVAGAILGSEFELELLRELVDLRGAALSEALDAAVAGGWLRVVTRGSLRHAFGHPLVHEVLRRVPPAHERVELHARAAAALAARHAGWLDEVAERLADHHLEMARGGHPDARAVEHSRRAAELAERRLAFDEAVHWFERALEALELEEAPDDEVRGELLVGLARTRWTVGDRLGARGPAEAAAALARRTQRRELLARAALVFWVRGAAAREHHSYALELMEEAERALRNDPGPLRAELLARMGDYLGMAMGAPWQQTRAVCEEALRLARAAGRPETLYTALYCTLFATWSALAPAQRRALTDELVELGERLADPSARIQASVLHLTCLLAAGDVAGADAEIARFAGEIERFEVPSFFRWYGPLYRGMRAVMAGRLEEGERLALESFRHAQRASVYDATRALAAQIFQIRSDQGRLTELEATVRAMAERYPNDHSFVPFHAYILTETGRAEAARPIFERFLERYDPRRDDNRCVTGTILATVCGALGDADRAASIERDLADDADQVTVNLSAWICQGSLHWPLGTLAATRGDLDTAARHWTEAERRNQEIGAAGFLTRTRLDLARLLGEQGAIGEARERARAALAAAREIGMAGVARRAEALLARLG